MFLLDRRTPMALDRNATMQLLGELGWYSAQNGIYHRTGDKFLRVVLREKFVRVEFFDARMLAWKIHVSQPYLEVRGTRDTLRVKNFVIERVK